MEQNYYTEEEKYWCTGGNTGMLPTRITPSSINVLEANEIFVFGSNIQGYHVGGAARVAKDKFGAVWGIGEGLQGKSYAIPTMESLVNIKPAVERFTSFARQHSELKFLVTAIGCGIAGYSPEEITPLLIDAAHLDNVYLPLSFWKVMQERDIAFADGQRSLTMELLDRCAYILDDENKTHFEFGDSYNLFDLLVSGDEEKMHSSIIASLLDPKGKHNQGSVFLKLFLIECGINGVFDIDTAYVTYEKDIGRIIGSGEAATGGRIDIFLQDKNKHRIIIENKWNASDQYHQLIRYHNYDSDSIILYLTRYGHKPSRYSIGTKMKDGEDFHCISYNKEISTWLKECIDAVKDKTYIAVAIDSYRKLITRLNMTGENDRILGEISTSKNTINAAFQISKALGGLKKKGQTFFWTELFNKFRDNGELIPEVCTHQKVSRNIDDILPAIKLYVDKEASLEKYRLYGIRCRIGNYLGEDVFAAIFVDTDIYFTVFAWQKKEFNEKAYEFFKSTAWNHTDSENIAWKRPGNDEKFDFRNFNNEDVYSLALGDITLVDYIYDEFLETVKIAQHNLSCLVTESK